MHCSQTHRGKKGLEQRLLKTPFFSSLNPPYKSLEAGNTFESFLNTNQLFIKPSFTPLF
jgi:hypothetical protein